MKKKMTYVAPETEQMEVRFECNIMSDVQTVTYVESNVDWE